MIYLTLFFEFFIIGSFSVGGGLATLPFLYNLADKYPWFNKTELIDMIAISESTPGPIGINMATYAGFRASGVMGGIVASLDVLVTGVVSMMYVGKVLHKFSDHPIVLKIFYGIRPTVTALIAYAAFEMIKVTLIQIDPSFTIDFFALGLFIVTYILLQKTKITPIFLIFGGAVIGILMSFL